MPPAGITGRNGWRVARSDGEPRGHMSLGVHDHAESTATLFSSSRRLVIADHFRIPYSVIDGPARPELQRLCTSGGRELLWPSGESSESPVAVRVQTVSGADIPIFARVLHDQRAKDLLTEYGGDWSRALSLVGEDGEHVASIWRADDGSVFLPFDPDEVCHSYWSESYLELARNGARRRTTRALVWSYYRVRGLLPRLAQIWLRRRYARVQARSQFPAWPAETALHDFFDLFTAILADISDEPVPRVAAWPDGHTWALVLTHDVETSKGLAALQEILDLERELGLR